MTLEGGKVFCYGEGGEIEKILEPNEKIFTIGYYVSCDVIHEHPEVKGIHCEIACDSFGRITVRNYCETRPIIVNGEAVVGTRPLLPGSTIEVVGKQFRWEYEHPSRKEDVTQKTPDTKANKVQQAPNSEPAAPVCRAVQKRLTVHRFAYGLNSNSDEDIENLYKCTVIQPLEMNPNSEIKNRSSTNSMNISSNNEKCKSKLKLSTCNHSDLVFTSYSPRTGVNTPKGFACVTPAKQTPKSFYSTPRSTLSEQNQSTSSRKFITPKGDSSNVTTTSMYLIDLITPLKPVRTPLKRTPLLKSALKNSVKSAAKDKGKKLFPSGSSATNIQGRKIALQTPVKAKSVSTTPKKSEKVQDAKGKSEVLLFESITDQSTINSDSVFCNNSSVIEISSDSTPGFLERKKQLKTQQLVPRKTISSSARKATSVEKEFVKKVKNNIERISENLPILTNYGSIKKRRSSLPAASTVVERQSSLSQSTTVNFFKPSITPKPMLTTSTPFRLQKSIPKMVQSTPLKTAYLTESFTRYSSISPNQTTPKVPAKTPQKSIIKKETNSSKKISSSVLVSDKFDRSVYQIKENEEDALNATFTIGEEEKHSDRNKNGSRNNQSEILELKPLEKIGDFVKYDCLKEEKEVIQPIVDEEIQGIDIPRQTNIFKTSKTSDNKNRLDKVSDSEEVQSPKISSKPFIACLTIETPKNVQTPDLKSLKDVLETSTSLNRTPIEEVFKTPKVEESESKEECVIKRLMRTPVSTPKALEAKQLFILSKMTQKENENIKEIVRVKDSQNSFVDAEEIKTLGDVLSPQKNGFEPSLKRSAGNTSTDVQTLGVLEDNKSFTKLSHDRYLDNPSTSSTEPKSDEPKTNIKTPKKKPFGMEDYTEFQERENSDIPNTSVAAIRRPSTFNIENPENLKPVEISTNSEIQSTQASTEHDSLPRKLRRSAAHKITTPTNLPTQKTTICVKKVTDLQSDENIEIENLAPNTLVSGHENIQNQVLETKASKLKTPTNLPTPQDTICSKHADEVQRSEKSENADILSTPVSGFESGQRKLRRYIPTKTKTPKNEQTPNKLFALEDDAELPKNANIPSTELQTKEIAEKSDFPNTVVTRNEPIQRKLQRSNTFDVDEVPKKMQKPGIETVLENKAEVQKCNSPKKSDITSVSAPGCELIENKVLRYLMEKTKTPKHSLDSLDYREAEENEDISVENLISKAETSTNQPTKTSFVLENNTGVQTGAVIKHSGNKAPLAAFKPVLSRIRKTTSPKVKTMTIPVTPETPRVLEDDAEVVRTKISEKVEVSTPDGQVQGSLQKSAILEAGTPVHLQTFETSIISNCDAEAARVQSPENENIPSSPDQVCNELQRSSIAKAKPQINPQSSETSLALNCDAETQNGEISEHPDIARTQVSQISKNDVPKRHSFMVIGKKMSAVKRVSGCTKESRRHSIGPSEKQNISIPTTNDNLRKTDLKAFSKNLNIVGNSICTPKKSPAKGNLKLKHNAQDKNKSFNKLTEDIESNDLPTKAETPKAEPRKLLKSATFIINSLKRPSISNSSSQKELTDPEIAYTQSENVTHSKQLSKAPEEVNLKESPKLSKTPPTQRPLGVKELYNTPKPSKDINFSETKELMKTPKVARDSDDNYNCLNGVLKTPKDSIKHYETPNKSFTTDDSCELGPYETLIIEDEGDTLYFKSFHEENELQVKTRFLERKYKSYPTTPMVELKRSTTKHRTSLNLIMETENDLCSTESVNTSKREFEQDQMEKCELPNTEMYSCPTSPVVGLENNLSRTRKSAVFYIDSEEERVCSTESLKIPVEECLQDQLEEYESSDNTIDVTSKDYLIKTPKHINTSPNSQKKEEETLSESKDSEKTTVLIGVKELLNTPKDESSENLKELGLKRLMKTPIKTPKPVRIKELFHIPKPRKEENLAGVKELMHEPRNVDQTVVMLGVKELLNTPENETSNEIRDLGLKRLMKTPAKTPKPVRIKELFYSPKPEKEVHLVGVKELMHTPKNLDQTTSLLGIKELLKTPKEIKSPIPLGIKEIFNSSRTEKEACLGDIKEIIKTPESLKYADINVTGVNELLETPKSDAITEDFLEAPEVFSTPHHIKINKKDEDLMKTPTVEFPDQEINQTSPSPKDLSPRKQISFKTPSAKTVKLLETPQSVKINTTKLVSSADPPPLYDLKENKEDIEEVLPTAVTDEENDAQSTEDSFDKLVEKPFVRRSSISQKNSSFVAQFNKPQAIELSKSVENAVLALRSEEIDENSKDVSDKETAFSMSGTKTLEKDEELEEMPILQNSQDEGVRNKGKIVTDLILSKIASPETSTQKKTENKNVETKMEYKKDDPSGNREENSETDSDVVRDDSIDQNVIKEEKEEEANIISDHISLEEEFAATTSKKSYRTRSKLSEKQKLITTKQTQIKRGRKKKETAEETLEVSDPSEEQTTDSMKTEINEGVEIQIYRNHSDENQLDSINEFEDIPEVKAALRGTRKTKGSNRSATRPERATYKSKASNSALDAIDQIEDREEHDDETEKHSSLSVSIKENDGSSGEKVHLKTKSVANQKRKSDSESEEAAVPIKRMVRKLGVDIKEEIKAVPRRKDLESEVTPSSERRTVKDQRKETTKIASPEGEIENRSEDTKKAKVETSSSRRGRPKRGASNNLNEIQSAPSSADSEAPPVRKGRPRRKAENVEPQDEIPENKVDSTSSRRGRRRKVEDVIDTQQDLAGLLPPQRGRGRRKVEEPKAERVKTNTPLNMSTDEETSVKPEILSNLSKVSTPKTQPKDGLEFKTPISAAPRAKRVLRSNSTSISTPQEDNLQETNVTNSIDKIEHSLPVVAIRTRGRRRLNSTKNEEEALEAGIGKLETSVSELYAAKSGRTKAKPKSNSTKEEKPTKDEVKITNVDADQPETSQKGRGRKKADTTKEAAKPLDVEVESTAGISTRTRARKRINSTKEEVQQTVDEEKEQPEIATSGRTRARRNVNSAKN